MRFFRIDGLFEADCFFAIAGQQKPADAADQPANDKSNYPPERGGCLYRFQIVFVVRPCALPESQRLGFKQYIAQQHTDQAGHDAKQQDDQGKTQEFGQTGHGSMNDE